MFLDSLGGDEAENLARILSACFENNTLNNERKKVVINVITVNNLF